jgi:hypothetical protein
MATTMLANATRQAINDLRLAGDLEYLFVSMAEKTKFGRAKHAKNMVWAAACVNMTLGVLYLDRVGCGTSGSYVKRGNLKAANAWGHSDLGANTLW